MRVHRVMGAKQGSVDVVVLELHIKDRCIWQTGGSRLVSTVFYVDSLQILQLGRDAIISRRKD